MSFVSTATASPARLRVTTMASTGLGSDQFLLGTREQDVHQPAERRLAPGQRRELVGLALPVLALGHLAALHPRASRRRPRGRTGRSTPACPRAARPGPRRRAAARTACAAPVRRSRSSERLHGRSPATRRRRPAVAGAGDGARTPCSAIGRADGRTVRPPVMHDVAGPQRRTASQQLRREPRGCLRGRRWRPDRRPPRRPHRPGRCGRRTVPSAGPTGGSRPLALDVERQVRRRGRSRQRRPVGGVVLEVKR